MKLPRDLSGTELAKKLKVLGYAVDRQSGSHIRLSSSMAGEHHITVPAHDPLKVGTLAGILGDIAVHHKISKEELLKRLF
jgi:predicted RNA binding protein YcfA (HicA-like mRNA interferase family)